MLAPAKRNATYQDVLDAPENMRAELIDGRLYLQPRPSLPHATAVTNLSGVLRLPFRLAHGGPGGWRFLVEPELRWSEPATALVPDIAGWREADLAPGALRGAYAEVTPAWVCEVLSPGTHAYDRGEKGRKYLQRGVDFLWLVDPIERIVEAFEASASGDHWVLRSTSVDNAPARISPFDAVPLDLSLVWEL